VQWKKCLETGAGRKQVLASTTPSPGANTDWIKIALQEKSKQSDVTTVMQQVYTQYQNKVAKKKKERLK
jgi:predicted DNA-binding protein (MmcQ/YjbR family)